MSDLERLIVKIASENKDWGCDRIEGAVKNLGFSLCDETVNNVLKRNGIPPRPRRTHDKTWHDFIKQHKDVMWACDFFTVEVLTWYGLVTYYVLFFIHIGSRKVHVAGVTPYPDTAWMQTIARNITMADWGILKKDDYLIHDRDGIFTKTAFDDDMKRARVKLVLLPPRSPNLNAFAERWVRSVRQECLNHFIPLGKDFLEHVLKEYVAYYNTERNHQGMDNQLLRRKDDIERIKARSGEIQCKQRLGGLLKYYFREAS
ncbi:integrase core domain-containing protein [Planctomycetota bacterium]